MKIGSIDLGKHPVFLAPMEDVTDISFRLMCKRFGADMVYTEFVSSDALIRSVNKTQEKLTVAEDERPVAIQIYGKEVDAMVEAAKICEAARPDILDINFGCPVKKVAGKGAGYEPYFYKYHAGKKAKATNAFRFAQNDPRNLCCRVDTRYLIDCRACNAMVLAWYRRYLHDGRLHFARQFAIYCGTAFQPASLTKITLKATAQYANSELTTI